jgi:hypothetical protein
MELAELGPRRAFAAIEGTAFHTRVILDRKSGNGVEIKRVIDAGGISAEE